MNKWIAILTLAGKIHSYKNSKMSLEVNLENFKMPLEYYGS